MFGVQGKGVKRAVSYVWQEEESKEQSHMFGVQGREESKSSSWIFLICLASKEENGIYYKTRHMHFVLTHTLQNEGNGFKDTSNS